MTYDEDTARIHADEMMPNCPWIEPEAKKVGITFDGQNVYNTDVYCELNDELYFKDDAAEFLAYLIKGFGADSILDALGAKEIEQ